MSLNMQRREEDFFVPISDREFKVGKIEEAFFYSGFYSFFLLLHNIVYIMVIKDALYVENMSYIFLLNVIVFVYGISIGTGMMGSRKKKKTMASWGECLVEVIFLVQHFDFLLLDRMIFKGMGLCFADPKWYIPVGVMVGIIELVHTIENCRAYDNHDYACVWIAGAKARYKAQRLRSKI